MSLMLLVSPMTGVGGEPVPNVFSSAMLIALPIMYLILGYIMTLVGAWIYNFVAKYTGGIQFEMEAEQEE